MKKEFDCFDGEAIASYEETPELKDQVFERVLSFFKSVDHFTGESLQQSDNVQELAPDLVSDIADNIIKFELTWKE
jgi:UDP:flavonoid glycosyltransferase YjiC (YdhE family)